MQIGYARVSTADQDLTLQTDALKQAGCDRIFTDKMSGAETRRAGLDQAVSHLRSGDTLVVWKLDRLGRTVKGLIDLVADLEGRGVQFQSITDSINTASGPGKFFFHVMAAMAEMERELIIERTRAGLAVAKAKGRLGGRKAKMTENKLDAARKLLSSGVRPRDVAANLGVSVPTLYRWVPAAAQVKAAQS